MEKAIEIAQAKHFISNKEKGLDSRVSQGGKNFSGGQKQRLCIARALAKNAEIYVFDDSFSVDNSSRFTFFSFKRNIVQRFFLCTWKGERNIFKLNFANSIG